MRSSTLSLTCIIFLFSCSNLQKEKHNYPKSNPYPEIFETIDAGDTGDLLKTHIKTSTIKFDCTERNDQPYFWCGIDAELVKRQNDLPTKLETIFHVQLPKWGVRNIEKLLKKIKKRSKVLTVVIHRNPSIDKNRNSFWNQLFVFHDEKSCVAFLNTEFLCPSEANIENIYLTSHQPAS